MSGFRTTVLDHDLEVIQLMRRFGFKGYFGDPTRPEILTAAGLDKARILVAALDDPQANLRLIRYAKEKRPDIVVIEGLNVLQPARIREDGTAGLAVSDFFDFSVYVDASRTDIRRWYTERFLRLRETAFRDPTSYFTKYADLTEAQAVDEAGRIWDTINGPNLARNIAPTRSRATLVLRKAGDHSVSWVRLRKL